jgi:hypothetical protein
MKGKKRQKVTSKDIIKILAGLLMKISYKISIELKYTIYRL